MAEGDKPVKKAKAAEGKGEPAGSPEAKRSKAEERAAKEATAKAAAAEELDASEESEEDDAHEGEGEPKESPKAKAPRAKPAKARPKDEDDGEDEDGDGEEGASAKKGNLKPRPKPKVDGELKRALELRKAKNADRQQFHRQEWFRYQRLGDKWRYPQGIQSKMRRHWGTHADVVSIGYRGPKAARGLHPSGFREVLIHNEEGLEGIDPARDAVRIAASVGRQKREAIQKGARKRGIRVLNWKVWRD